MNEHTTSDRIIEEYLGELRDALRSVNPSDAREFVAEIEQHIAEGRATLEPGDEVGLRNLLERIGSPSALASELEETESPRAVSGMDRATPWLIMFGGFAFGFGWLVGLYGLWSSKTWRIWDKLLGTFIWPGGLLGIFYLFLATSSVTTCSGFSRAGQTAPTLTCVHNGIATLPRALQFLAGVVIVAAPIFTSFRLGSVLSRGYADASNPRGVRLVSLGRAKRTSTLLIWISLGLLVLFLFNLVLA
ncbi:MAG: hypothetical protein HKL85_07575 [Acidimicrobiaceae bacterium]|nr:hypothetical protein [Acidimicrobiaceae bacterium]